MNKREYSLVKRIVADLKPYDCNARVHNEAQVAQIAASIKEFGFTNPVLIDEHNTIIAGEGRVLAAEKLQLETVPCIVLTGLTDAQRAAYVIADNKLVLNGGWDDELLRAELARIADLDLSMALTGFSEVEFTALFEQAGNGLDAVLNGSSTTQAGDATPMVACEWGGMPEFDQPAAGPFRTIYVHFNDQAAVDAFAQLISRRLTDKTKSVWYPEQPKAAKAEDIYV